MNLIASSALAPLYTHRSHSLQKPNLVLCNGPQKKGEGKPGISVFDHLVNVGCVAHGIAEMWPEVLEYFNFRSKEIGVLAAP